MTTTPSTKAADELLDRMQYRADELADATIENILGPWQLPLAQATATAPEAGPSPAGRPTAASLAATASQWQDQWEKLAAVTAVFSTNTYGGMSRDAGMPKK